MSGEIIMVTDNEIILTSNNITSFLNIIDYLIGDNFSLRPFIIERELFRVNLGTQVNIDRLLNKNDYNEQIYPINKFPEFIPRYSSIRRILIGSGLWRFNNWDQLISEINNIFKNNPLMGDQICFIGLDSNCLINRIYSNLQKIFKQNMSRLGIALSMIVRIELGFSNKIISNRFNKFMNNIHRDQDIFDEFWNGETFDSRFKKIGFVEFNKIQANSNFIIDNSIWAYAP